MVRVVSGIESSSNSNIFHSKDLRSAARKRLFACGSMVLAVLSVRPGGTRFFALAERKNRVPFGRTKEDEVPLQFFVYLFSPCRAKKDTQR
jgi:hypothetical protein